eukprot:m.12494 g.12494  ORF g.12494 m.12494 type:complete len:423 (-) comp4554_c0_seq1:1112-2380(-)
MSSGAATPSESGAPNSQPRSIEKTMSHLSHELSRLLSKLRNHSKGKASVLLLWLRRSWGAQQYEVRTSGGWKTLGLDSDDELISLKGKLELKFRFSGEEVILRRPESSDNNLDQPEFRVQYRKRGQTEFTTIASGRAPPRVRALEPVVDKADQKYWDVEQPSMTAQLMTNVQVIREADSPGFQHSAPDASPADAANFNGRGMPGRWGNLSPSESSAWSASTSSSSLCSAPSPWHQQSSRKITVTREHFWGCQKQSSRTASTKSPTGKRNKRQATRSQSPLRRVDSGSFSRAELDSIATLSPETPRPAGLDDSWGRAASPFSPASTFNQDANVSPASSSSEGTINLLSDDFAPKTGLPVTPPSSTSPTPKTRRRKTPAWRKALNQELEQQRAAARESFHPLLDAKRLKKSQSCSGSTSRKVKA